MTNTSQPEPTVADEAERLLGYWHQHGNDPETVGKWAVSDLLAFVRRVAPDAARHYGDAPWERVVDAETDDNEERGDLCMALREAGYGDAADDAGGMTIEDARETYNDLMAEPWTAPEEGTPVVSIRQAPGDEGTAYTLRLPDGREAVVSETGDHYAQLAHIIDAAFGDD